jgi:hypothetical protein
MHVKHNIPHLYIQPSSWRWTLGFETCRRHTKNKNLNMNLEAVHFVGSYCIITVNQYLFLYYVYRNPFLSLIITGNYFIASFTHGVASKFAVVAMKAISHIQKYNTEFLDTLSSISIPHSKCAVNSNSKYFAWLPYWYSLLKNVTCQKLNSVTIQHLMVVH